MQHNIGHRERIRDRLINSKPGGIEDYELLEILLCFAFPRQDVRILAKTLIAKYGSFAKVISAEKDSLLSVKGIGPAALACFRLIKEGSARLSREELKEKPILSSWQNLLDYCRITIGHLTKEVFMMLTPVGQEDKPLSSLL